MGEFLMSGDDPFLGFDLVNALDHVTVDQVKEAIALYLRPERRTVISGLPAEEDESEEESSS